jgi:hypothetical protein
VIKNDLELETTLERIRYFHRVVARLRETETNPANYKSAAGGFLAEIDRMNLEVREYLSLHPSEAQEEFLPTGTR